MQSVFEKTENMMEKGENADSPFFLLFQLCAWKGFFLKVKDCVMQSWRLKNAVFYFILWFI